MRKQNDVHSCRFKAVRRPKILGWQFNLVIAAKGWDKLGQKGSVQAYKDVGCGGPTLYRHDEGATLGFYDGHAQRLPKNKVWIAADYNAKPKRPGMWVANEETWNKYR